MTSFHRRLSFNAEWYHEDAAIVRPFTICFYSVDNSIEVFDQRTKKVFLRRTKMPDISERDFFVGSKLNIFGRQFDIVDYADELTRNILAKYLKKTFMLVKNSILPLVGDVLCALLDSNFAINRAMMVQFMPDHVKEFLKNKGEETSVLMNQLLLGPCIGFELVADNAIDTLYNCVHPGKDTPESMRKLASVLASDEAQIGIYCSKNSEEVQADLDLFFDKKNALQLSCTLQNTTLGLIKPHSIKEGNLGKMLKEIINNGFEITALRMNLMERINCEEFYEVYRGILPEYIQLVSQLASGVSLALEVKCKDPSKNTHEEFRAFCGPMDPEIAKLLRPHTLRAKFGVSKVLNAIHCTDLPEDTVLELQYLFKILN